MIFNQPGGAFVNNGNIEGGASIDTSGFTLTNSDSGRIIGGVTFVQGGNTLINQVGGIIRNADLSSTAGQIVVTGSAGADTFINNGRVNGLVSLGDGNDVYVESEGSTTGPVALGSGDDTFRFEGTTFRILSANGGDGWDRLIMANSYGHVGGNQLTSFEELVLEQDGNIDRFSGFQSIVLASTDAFTWYNFVNSLNPAVDLVVSGQAIGLQSSALRSVTGSQGAETVELGRDSAVSQGIALGGGDDTLRLWNASNAQPFTVGGRIEGGTGRDTIEILQPTISWGSADTTYNFASFDGFERLFVNNSFGNSQVTARISNVSGVDDLRVGSGMTMFMSASQLPTANLAGIYATRIELSSDVVIGRVGNPLEPSWDQRVDLPQADDAQSSVLTNRGVILGEVRFSIGDDVYDGRSGSVGGTVYGNGGNDRLLGGAGSERLEGGFGADYLSGGNGNDILLGGFGRDVMIGGAGNDIYEVDNVGDITWEVAGEGIADNVFAYVDLALPDHVDNLIMLYGNQRFGYGNSGDNIIIGNSSDNAIEGGAGYDTMTGGAGSDLYVVRPGWYVDVITDFVAGGGTQDAVLFDSRLFTSFAQVMGNSAQVGNDTWIGDGFGNTVVLVGVARSSLHPDDFGFI